MLSEKEKNQKFEDVFYGRPMTPKEQRQRVGFIPLSFYEARKDEKGNLRCVNCDAVLTGRRKKYCSDKCSREIFVKSNWGALRDKTLIESNFTCVKCGFHVEKTDKPHVFDDGYKSGYYFYRVVAPEGDSRLGQKTTNPSGLFVVDHILAICLGGGEFDENNLQVLCKRCNGVKTKRDMEKLRIKDHECMLGPEWVDFWDNVVHQKKIWMFASF